MIRVDLLLCFSLICFLNCASAPKTAIATSGDLPDWVNNPNKSYPDSRFIVGVGTADTRNAAEKDAVGKIAKVFQSIINVDETVIENYLETEGSGESEFSFSSQLLNRTSVGSQQELKNIKIDEVHFSSSDGLYYALAYLNRAETAGLYEQDIKNNEEKIVKYFDNYKNSTNKLNKYAYLGKCKTITAVNGLLRNQYQIITRGQNQAPISIPLSEIDKEMLQLLNNISVALYPNNNTPPEVGDYLKEVIGKIGFKIVDDRSDFTFNYGLSIEPTELNRENLVAYNWKLTIEAKDNVNNFALKSFNISKRTAAISEGEAKARIMRTLQSQLDTKFYKQFISYINLL